MNKFDLMNKVWTSNLTSTQKNLLCYLIGKSDTKTWESWPTTARLAQVAGVKYEKNFTLLDYLDGFVTVKKVGRQNHYVLNIPAVKGVSQGTVILKNTVSRRNTPAPADNTPAVEGTDSTSNTSRDSTRESTRTGLAAAHPSLPGSAGGDREDPPLIKEIDQPSIIPDDDRQPASLEQKNKDTPSTAGVKTHDDACRIAEREGITWYFTKLYGKDLTRNDFDRLLDEARAAKAEADADADWL